jgi:hypothetical protein
MEIRLNRRQPRHASKKAGETALRRQFSPLASSIAYPPALSSLVLHGEGLSQACHQLLALPPFRQPPTPLRAVWLTLITPRAPTEPPFFFITHCDHRLQPPIDSDHILLRLHQQRAPTRLPSTARPQPTSHTRVPRRRRSTTPPPCLI